MNSAAFRRKFTCLRDLMRTAASDRQYRFREIVIAADGIIDRNNANNNSRPFMHSQKLLTTPVVCCAASARCFHGAEF